LPVQRPEGLERCPESAGGGGGAMIPTHGSPGSIQRSTSPSDIRRPRRLRPAGTRVRADTSARLMPAGHLTRRRQRINVEECYDEMASFVGANLCRAERFHQSRRSN
jgi:hypothetical protein